MMLLRWLVVFVFAAASQAALSETIVHCPFTATIYDEVINGVMSIEKLQQNLVAVVQVGDEPASTYPDVTREVTAWLDFSEETRETFLELAAQLQVNPELIAAVEIYAAPVEPEGGPISLVAFLEAGGTSLGRAAFLGWNLVYCK